MTIEYRSYTMLFNKLSNLYTPNSFVRVAFGDLEIRKSSIYLYVESPGK